MALFSSALPDFPWDTLVPDRKRAALYPGGVVDLTIGTPVDDVPEVVQNALLNSANAHGYPPNMGSKQLIDSISQWLQTERGISSEVAILPTLGSKEMIALLPAMLGLDSTHKVAFPLCAYPTYDVGAKLAGAGTVTIDTDTDPNMWPADIDLLWLNSPGNPDGHVLDRQQLKRIINWARSKDVIVASDECYASLTWDVSEAPSVLNDEVCGGDPSGLIVLYSLSKESNIAGYRAAFVAGDPNLLGPVTELRKHAGFIMPGPVQNAMIAALGDRQHVVFQKELYRCRREKLLAALTEAGLQNDPCSVAGLYLWAGHPAGFDAWTLTHAFAELGIVVAPGTFYGESGNQRVRISLTASDTDIDEAARRIKQFGMVLERINY
ncbi:succinyldiaminopimelate transaminase [Arcanobacterium ihumii]|uniref:succinyldiaminopimelate transaminase n=1 Tax=Arcanobacterium ihumii TaxID=2138162 RepID=UPI000F531644|nr:succinyldiaminopimelate transaminase [Arcanobacterium ihumii]